MKIVRIILAGVITLAIAAGTSAQQAEEPKPADSTAAVGQPAPDKAASVAEPAPEAAPVVEPPADKTAAVAEPTSEKADPEATDAATIAEKDQPLNLWADQIVYEGNGFTCTGSVVLVRGESRIECEKLIGTIADVEKADTATGQKKTEKAITNLTASGSPIKMDSGERHALCLQAIYDIIEGKIVLTGSKENPPELVEKNGRKASGTSITFFLNEKTSDDGKCKVIVEGGPITIPVKSGMPGLPK